MSQKSKRNIYRVDEYESASDDEPDTLISRNHSYKKQVPKKNTKQTLKPKKSKTPRKERNNKNNKKIRERSQSCPPGQTGRDLWLNAVKNRHTAGLISHRPESPRHKTPTEFWIDTLRKTGIGRSTESTSMNTFSGVKKPRDADMPYLSTSSYMRQMMGTEKPRKQDNNVTAKPPTGTPSYKSQEEYYDQIIELKRQIQGMNQETASLKSKLRRVEEDNIKKEKEIDGLLNPSKNEELRRTMGDKRPESGAVIHSLKQKIMKLETQLRDKEASYVKLQTDLKTTKIEEMKIQLESCYHEIVRLQQSKDSGIEKTIRMKNEGSKMDKAVKDTILRLNKQIDQLKTENKTLREDLNRDIAKTPREYEDMNRKQLLTQIQQLEKKLKYDGDSDSVQSMDTRRPRNKEGKIQLTGSVEQRLDQLDKRETGLLEEISKQNDTIKRLKVYRKRCEEKDKEIAALLEELEQRGGGVTSRRSPTPRKSPGSSSRPPSGRRVSLDSTASEDRRQRRREDEQQQTDQTEAEELKRQRDEEEERIAKYAEDMRQKHAAKSIQKEWSLYKQRKATKEEEEAISKFQQNRAARKIQNEWTQYRYRKHEGEVDQATELIQSAMRGHQTRRKRMKKISHDDDSYEYEDDDESYDNAINLIQSSFHGHVSRKKKLRNSRHMDDYSDDEILEDYSRRPPSNDSMRNRPSSAMSRGSISSKKSNSSFRAKTTAATYSNVRASDYDDDDDIAF